MRPPPMMAILIGEEVIMEVRVVRSFLEKGRRVRRQRQGRSDVTVYGKQRE